MPGPNTRKSAGTSPQVGATAKPAQRVNTHQVDHISTALLRWFKLAKLKTPINKPTHSHMAATIGRNYRYYRSWIEKEESQYIDFELDFESIPFN